MLRQRGEAFPRPYEQRRWCLSLLGVPLKANQRLVQLPPRANEVLTQVSAQDFEHLFPLEWR
jgi:hypothetical protein